MFDASNEWRAVSGIGQHIVRLLTAARPIAQRNVTLMGERTGFPAGSVRLVEPFGAGGGPDLLARELAGRLSAIWGRPVVVENVPGGGSTAAPALVAESPADGHTVLINTSAHAYIAAVSHDLPYDPLEDFTPVAPLTEQAYVFVTGRGSGIGTLHDLVAAAAARPSQLTFGSTGAGTGSHLGAALLNLEAGMTAVHVPPAPGDSIVEVVAQVARGVTDYLLSPISIAGPYLDAGTLVALGVSTALRSPWLPHVPTVAEQGVDGFDFPIWYGAWVRAGTSPDIVRVLGNDLSEVMESPELERWCTRHGAEPMRMATAEFARFVMNEARRSASIIQRAGMADDPPT
jgi:tripartite-type tricarboxylate transporter receptor subunit TctC